MRFDELFSEVERVGADGWEALSWRPGAGAPELLPVARFTARPYRGDVVDIRTKMGRRLTVTADHPVIVGDGRVGGAIETVLAGDLRDDRWLPVAQGFPLAFDDPANPGYGRILDAVTPAALVPEQVITRLDDVQRDLLDTNGTYVPDVVPFDEQFWRMVGLWLAEGHLATDGRRTRLAWSFAPDGKEDLAAFVAEYWEGLGVKTTTRRLSTARQVSISSRLLGAWFEHVLRTGRSAYDKRVPDAIWSAPEVDKRALLRGLWDGDGSWSLIRGGPSVVLEYGTVSRSLADGMVRLLGDLGIVARLKVGRTAKSTVDTYWLVISGAGQVERALWLLPPAERAAVGRATGRQSKRIAPTGYRRFDDDKAVAWVRVTSAERRPFDGTVYSLSVPDTHTVVASYGLVTHNCFPKDSRALVRIAEEAGYDFDLLRGVIALNEEQFDRVTKRTVDLVGGSVDGLTLAVWGLTFKARTDDLRESPALAIVKRLRDLGATIRAYDPSIVDGVVNQRQAALLEGIEIVGDAYAACDGAAALVLLTEWDEFRWLDFDKVGDAMAEKRVIDARNILDRGALRRRGFTYTGVGRL
jgi:UDPglucose 6-dehydrogenase